MPCQFSCGDRYSYCQNVFSNHDSLVQPPPLWLFIALVYLAGFFLSQIQKSPPQNNPIQHPTLKQGMNCFSVKPTAAELRLFTVRCVLLFITIMIEVPKKLNSYSLNLTNTKFFKISHIGVLRAKAFSNHKNIALKKCVF